MNVCSVKITMEVFELLSKIDKISKAVVSMVTQLSEEL